MAARAFLATTRPMPTWRGSSARERRSPRRSTSAPTSDLDWATTTSAWRRCWRACGRTRPAPGPEAMSAAVENASVIDQVRACWNRRPCNIRHSTKPVGTREYFDEVEERKYFVEPHIPAFADFARWRGKKVLEIGCGIGTDSINFARAGADITVVDLSRESLDVCRKRFDVFGLKAEFYEGDAEHLSEFVPVEKYDLIYSFGV